MTPCGRLPRQRFCKTSVDVLHIDEGDTMASKGVNKVILIGSLGRDPEVKYMPSGVAITTLSVATSESWVDQQTNEKQERTEWHRVTLFRKLAEIAGEYLKKGSKVYIEGSLRTRKWTDKDGVERYSTEINANEMQMLGDPQGGRDRPGGGGGAGNRPAGGQGGSSYGNRGGGGAPPRRFPDPASDPDFDDSEIPF